MRLRWAGRDTALPSTVKTRALLAHLVLEGRPLARERLCELLWPDVENERARASLRVALSQLRGRLPDRILSEGAALRFVLEPDDGVDVLRFLEALDDNDDPAAVLRALEGYRADFLSGLEIPECSDFETWRLNWRDRLDARARDGWLALADSIRPDRSALALGHLQRACAFDPLHEPSQGALMLALGRMGRHTAALAHFARLQAGLAEVYGVEPSSSVLALRERILAARARDEPRELPRAATPFIGREPEIDRIIDALCEPGRAPVTIVGPGGIGKTRLAIEVAGRMGDGFLDGSRFVSLADLVPGASIASRLAMELGLKLVGAAAAIEQVKEALRERELLLLLDNFETAVGQGGIVEDLLAVGPAIRVLITSREPLGLAGERVLRVAGLSYPVAADEPSPDPAHGAVALFVAAARRVKPDFDAAREMPAIGKLCRQVQGYPLALELAAAWVADSDCATIADRLSSDLAALPSARGLPDRHTSLEAVFEHTWRLLDGTTRLAFTRLCVFQDGFDLAAAEAVAGLGEARLTDLVSRSLVADLGGGRFAIHAVLRHFGGLRLTGSSAIALRLQQVHARYFLERFSATSAHHGAESKALVAWVERDAENLAGAWRSAVEQRSLDLIAPVAVDLAGYYYAQGPSEQGIRVCQDGIACCKGAENATGDPSWAVFAARLIAERGFFELRAGRAEAAAASADRSLSLLAGHPTLSPARSGAASAAARRLRGILQRSAGAFDAATVDLDRAVADARAAGEERLAAEAAYHRAGIEVYRGEVEACLAATQAVLESIQSRGYLRLECAIHFTLSVLQDRGGDIQAGMDSSQRCLTIAETAAYPVGQMNAASSIGQLLYRMGRIGEALAYLERAAQLAAELGHRATERNARLAAAIALTDLGRPAEAGFHIESVCNPPQVKLDPREDAQRRLRLAYLQRAAQEGRAAMANAETALETFERLGDEAHAAVARAEIGRAAAKLGNLARARQSLDLAIHALAVQGEHTQCLVARTDRAALPLMDDEPLASRRAEVEAIREAAVATRVDGVIPVVDLVLGRLLFHAEPRAAEAALQRAKDHWMRADQPHRALEAAAALARLHLDRGRADAARERVEACLDGIFRYRLFGLEAPERSVEDLQVVLAALDHPRAEELERWLADRRAHPTTGRPG